MIADSSRALCTYKTRGDCFFLKAKVGDFEKLLRKHVTARDVLQSVVNDEAAQVQESVAGVGERVKQYWDSLRAEFEKNPKEEYTPGYLPTELLGEVK